MFNSSMTMTPIAKLIKIIKGHNFVDNGVVVHSYAPTWQSRYTLDLDNEGWSIVNPAFDSKIMYVDLVSGDDGEASPHTNMTLGGGTPRNPGSVNAYKTIEAAMLELREGYPDWLVVKRGQTFTRTSTLTFPSGRSLTERAVFTSYGDEADGYAVLDGDFAGSGGYLINNSQPTNTQHWAMMGIHLTCSRRNPDNPSFYGWYELPELSGALHLQDSDAAQNILIEDCRFSWLRFAYYAGSDLLSFATPTNFNIRRCVFHHCIDGNAVKLTQTEGWLDQNVFYQCGWWSDYANNLDGYAYRTINTTLAADLNTDGITSVQLAQVISANTKIDGEYTFEITTDLGNTKKVTVTAYNGTAFVDIEAANFAADPASNGNAVSIVVHKGFWGQVRGDTLNAISGAAVTQIQLKQSQSGDYRQGMKVSLTGQQGTLYEIPIQSVTGDLVYIPETNFSEDPVAVDTMVILHVFGPDIGRHSFYPTMTQNLIFSNNVSINPASQHVKVSNGATDAYIYTHNTAIYNNLMLGGEIGISAGGNGSSEDGGVVRFDVVEIISNYIIDAGRNRWRGVGNGIEHKDNQNSRYTHNVILSRVTPASSYALKVSLLADNDVVTDNISNGAGAISLANTDQNIEFLGNVEDHASHSGWITVPAFLTSLGETGDIEEFAALMIERRKGNWLTYDRDYIDAINTSININTPIVINQPTSYTLGDGVTATFKFDAYTPYGTTFEWLDEINAVVVADSSRELDVVTSESTNGNQYKLRATLTDETTLDSNLATLTLEDRQVLTLTKVESGSTTNEPEIDLTFDGSDTITIAAGMSVKYTIGYTQSISRMGVLLDSVTSNKVHHRWSGSVSVLGEDIDTGVVMSDGLPHEVTVRMPQAGQKHQVTVDGSMTKGATTHANGNSFTLSRIGLHKFNDTGSSMFIYDVQIIDTDGETILYQFDIANGAHSGATEAASIGSGTATFNNIALEDWA